MKFAFKILVVGILIIGCNDRGAKSDKEKTTTSLTEKQPNVLIIYPDQLRRYSAGFWSEPAYEKLVSGKPDPVITPNMDMLAKNGIVFTHAISNFPLCSPARGMLLSGRYPEQNGIWNNCRDDRDESLRDDIPVITDLFYQSGYSTAYFGKCHWLKNDPLFDADGNYVGSTESPGGNYMNRYDTYVPPGKSRHNIEYMYQSIKDSHYDPHIYSSDPNTIAGKKDGELYLPKIFSPKNEAEKIVAYLTNENEVRDVNKPFFLMWSINPPHNPWDDKNTDMEALEAYYDTDNYPNIDRSLVVRENADLETAQYARHYFANVTSTDKYIGIVLEELEKLGELENTIVVLSADHGEMLGSHGKTGKNTFETESLAIPFIVHWPDKLKKGTVTDVLFSVTDVLPTTMGLAGLEKEIPEEVEGINFSKLLLDPKTNYMAKPSGALLMLSNSRGIYTDRYTLCLDEKAGAESKSETKALKEAYIYDREKDPYQLNKIQLQDLPDVSEELLPLLGKALKKANDPWYQQRRYDELIVYPI
ncbi:sulfatase-like hydrolase/transferase [Kriegella aquimaris]|uniref:Arylsulfatase A n=1 Tax=Kriegella aquimaris TaxID=192904 RepID=A0A1G9S2D5_9FLAO|nr:sulfatase-like hydrolase/transferase [Kriegella aquimaris]SDM29631.1 Arylsulfatase A [Kriegella aquimaris]